MHRITINITRASEGKEQLGHVAKLAEKLAVDRGADLLSELFIYSVAGGTVYYEYRMQLREKAEKAAKEASDEAARREEKRKTDERQSDDIRFLNQRVSLLQEEIRDLRLKEEKRRDTEILEQQRRQRRRWFGVG